MAISFTTALRDARAQKIIDAMDAGASAGKLQFYDGVQPAAGAAITTEILIGTNLLSDPSATITGGVLTLDPVSDDVAADADGIITWARITDSNDLFVMDLDCGVAGSGAAIIFNTTVARLGGVIQVLSGTLTEGNA
jgi:hypothetical protein